LTVIFALLRYKEEISREVCELPIKSLPFRLPAVLDFFCGNNSDGIIAASSETTLDGNNFFWDKAAGCHFSISEKLNQKNKLKKARDDYLEPRWITRSRISSYGTWPATLPTAQHIAAFQKNTPQCP
jgi:hypothetical protein